MVHQVGHYNMNPAGRAAYDALFPRPLSRQTNAGRAMLERRATVTEDVETDTERSEAARNAARLTGLRSVVSLPMLRDGPGDRRHLGRAATPGRSRTGTSRCSRSSPTRR
jgi:hypothetical protein